ncbi:MAG: cell division protein CrgA [Acidimicrobiales bacterium]
MPREAKVSPRWVPVLMFVLLLGGAGLIILNYLNLLPGDADNTYLLVGLALITGGFITATQYH